MSEHTRNMYGFRTYEETPKFYISDLRPWPNVVHIIKGHSGDVMSYVPAPENARLRELVRDMWSSYCYANSGCETFLTDEQDAAIRERVRRLKVINK